MRLIDVREAEAWMLVQAQNGTAGTFNLTRPLQPLTMGQWLETPKQQLQPAANTATWLAQGASVRILALPQTIDLTLDREAALLAEASAWL